MTLNNQSRKTAWLYSIFTVAVIAAAVILTFKATANNYIINSVRDEARQDISKKFRPTRPEFYRGIYLSNDSACMPARFRKILDEAAKNYINTVVMDVQDWKHREKMVPSGHIEKCILKDIHPIARIVVFPNGLSDYPPNESYIEGIIDIAERAAKNGFREIQFDYIRFSDEPRYAKKLKHVKLEERHAFIEKFLSQAKVRLSVYGIAIATDVFGRVPHNINDPIGQKMEVFDRHVDVICPMAYPSHYWNKKLIHDPYGTVLWTSSEANRRAANADIVTWIQAFKMKHPPGMDFVEYIQHQIRAVHDSGIKGFLLWNAKQDYSHAYKAVSEFYSQQRNINQSKL